MMQKRLDDPVVVVARDGQPACTMHQVSADTDHKSGLRGTQRASPGTEVPDHHDQRSARLRRRGICTSMDFAELSTHVPLHMSDDRDIGDTEGGVERPDADDASVIDGPPRAVMALRTASIMEAGGWRESESVTLPKDLKLPSSIGGSAGLDSPISR